MRSSLVIAAATALVVAAAFALSRPWSAPALSETVAKQQAGFLLLPPAAPAGQMVLYGRPPTRPAIPSVDVALRELERVRNRADWGVVASSYP
jgi:hypothetical protein